jgi:acyl-CoA synthetase (AMP-forming)/AMP-acid ligase II
MSETGQATVTAAEPTGTLLDLVEQYAICQPDKTAFAFLGDGTNETERLGYAALRSKALSIAARLRRLGISRTPALLVYPPGLDFVAALIACLYAGAPAVPAPYPAGRRGWERIDAIARDAVPSAVLTLGRLLDDQSRDGLMRNLGHEAWIATDLIDNDPSADHGGMPRPEDIALLQYTSGSTLQPRGVMISHANLWHNQQMMASVLGHTSASVGVNWVPVFHDMGLIGAVLQTIHCGSTSYLLPPLRALQHPILWLQAISTYRGNTSTAPTFAYELCVRRIPLERRRTLDLSSWDVAICGAEPVRAEVLEEFADAFAEVGFSRRAFVPAYGLAEVTLLATATRKGEGYRTCLADIAELANGRARPPDTGAAKRLVCCGTARLGQEVVIVDPATRRRLQDGLVGEIWLAGGSVAQGYWTRPSETQDTFAASLADESGGRYLRTGDLGFLDGNGLFVTGRLKELIVIHGRNYYPQDLEETVRLCHPDLADGAASAFGIQVGGGEAVVVVSEVPRQAARTVACSAVIGAAKAAVFRDFGIRLHDLALLRPGGLPRTTSGKVQRGRCRELYLAGALPMLEPVSGHQGPSGNRMADGTEVSVSTL